MQIVDLYLHAVRVPRLYSTRVAPEGGHRGAKDDSDYVLLELVAENGIRGLGEISDLEPWWNTPDLETLDRILRPLVVGGNLDQRHHILAQTRTELPDNLHSELRTLTAAAVDIGLLDLASRVFDVPAWELLGGRRRRDLPVSWVAYIRSPEEMTGEIEEKVRDGFRAFKLKVGEDFEQDCARVSLCRRLVGPQGYIKIDASGQWEQDEAVDCLNRFGELGVDAVETPLRMVSRKIAKDSPHLIDDDPHTPGMALARVRERVPVAVIEHVADFSDAFALALIRHGSVDAFNIVPVQAGSIARCLALAHLASLNGTGVLLGSTVELGVATSAGLHLGVALQDTPLASDLVGPGLLTGDAVRPRLRYEAGCLSPPDGPGLGVELDLEAMQAMSNA